MNENKKNIFIGFIVFTIMILFLYFFWKNNLILAVLFLAVSAVILLNFSSKEEKVLYFISFVLCPVFDLILVPRGLWTYANPFVLGVPLWLPLTYGLGTVMIVKIGNSIARLI